jgi:hypothetical protein
MIQRLGYNAVQEFENSEHAKRGSTAVISWAFIREQ